MRTILVVEPHAATLALLVEELQLAGFRVVRAEGASSGYELYLQERPEAVVLAVDLPRLGELSLGRRIRDSAGGERLPLIAIDKGHLGKALGVQAVLEARVDAYVSDPTRPALKERLRELLAHAPGDDGMQQVLARPPVRSGPLEPLSVSVLLVQLAHARASGVLVARSRSVERRLHLLDGHVIGFDSTSRAETPIRWLHGRELISPEQAGATLAAMAAEGLTTDVALIATGVMPPPDVTEFLRAYHRWGASLVLSMRDGLFQLHDGREHAASIAAAAVPVAACVIEATRSQLPARTCARALAPRLALFPRLVAGFSEDLAALQISRAELRAAMLLDGSTALRDLLAGGRGELRLRYALYLGLGLCGYVEFLGSQAPASGRVIPRPLPRGKPLPPQQSEAIRDAALRALTGSYFQVLGLSIAATTDDVERAYHEVASRFHPEVFAGHDLGGLAEILSTLQDRIDAAYRVLSSEPRRKAYLEHVLKRLEPGGRTAAPVPEAEVELQRGLSVLEADPRGAAAAFERALALNPKEPAYYGYLAWARFRGATVGSPEDRAKDAMRMIKKGLAARPDDDRLIAILGILEAESGNPAEARRHLSQALRRNESNRLARAALRRLNRLPG